jgi:hypothetical protein
LANARAPLCLCASLLLGCEVGASHEQRTPSASPEGFASAETIRLQRGMRSVEVHCALDCGNAQVELSRLQRDCVRDPQSTVHHVTENAPMIALGCCTESTSVFVEACGEESTLGACVRRWQTHCDRGELLEHAPAEGS